MEEFVKKLNYKKENLNIKEKYIRFITFIFKKKFLKDGIKMVLKKSDNIFINININVVKNLTFQESA